MASALGEFFMIWVLGWGVGGMLKSSAARAALDLPGTENPPTTT
jgi:hypothetical protein